MSQTIDRATGHMIRQDVVQEKRTLYSKMVQFFTRHTPNILEGQSIETSTRDLLDGLITDLDLSHNELTSLPEWIHQLSNLERLHLNHNQLTSLPRSIGQLSKLKKLNLDHNQLTSLPESIGQLSHLKFLTLRHNGLTSLPESVGQLSSLVGLYLNHNGSPAYPNQLVD